MLNNRQDNIYNYFIQNTETYFTSRELAKVFNVSDRTIATDLDIIKSVIEKYDYVSLESKPGSGTILKILNQQQFDEYILNHFHNPSQRINNNYSDQKVRAKSILKFLIDSSLPVSKYNLIGLFYISESTLYNDFKIIEEILENYDIFLKHTTGVGYYIEGNEKDKRKCIIEENLYDQEDFVFLDIKNKSHLGIKKIVIDVLEKHNWSISDYLLENLLNHIVLMSHRIENNQLIDYYETPDIQINSVEYNIAKEIIETTISEHRLSKKNIKYENLYLATNLISKSNYETNNELKETTIDFIKNAFKKIYTEFGIDFTQDTNFINTFALHVAQMIRRIKYDFQLKSNQQIKFKQLFPVATNIATYFAQLVDLQYNTKPNDGEIAYLTSYFNYAINYSSNTSKDKNVLLITKYRESELLTLTNMLYTWFKNQITEIEIQSINAIKNIDISEYDVLLTTEDNLGQYKGAAIKVNLFPNDDDFNKINLALNGYNNINSIVSKFSEDLFFKGAVGSKEDILNIFFELAENKFDINNDFQAAILAREDYGTTFYDNLIAIPHPITPITDKTFVILALLDEPIKWNDANAQIILLINIEKNNPKAFHLWHYLSYLISNEQLIKEILSDLTFENFITQLRKALAPIFVSD